MMPRLEEMRAVALAIALTLAGPALAAVAGPPVPAIPRQTPAEQAIAYTHRDDPPPPRAPAPVTCRKANGEKTTACGVKEGARPPTTLCGHKKGEIVVCAATGRSPDRIPLPNERGPAHHPGEFARPDAGSGPIPVRPGITVATFGMSRAVKMRNATLKMIYAQEKAKAAADQAAAEKARLSETSPPE
ncbi:hypothetical protein Q4F19_05800 [Sphingomonas sp. BIUV-7]|uniref:Uncharacterized protein n=1 Tax=Sphingomonas natans TaxID=3063330 RepID=A0ABT8Y6E4_9SPHN|nr:hypothetical protein [Sphingomonas sp. BIUV-7]MDO6413888.1 hypothetical protein [Sphingomonas sp. BIUV-7]